jgi:hypothetical protein
MIAENISTPTVILDHPTRENFEHEARKRYDYVGISSLTPNMNSVMEMARIVRRVSPHTKTVLGSFATNAREQFDPRNRYIPTLPCKKYIYNRENANGDTSPYKLIYPNKDVEYRRYSRHQQVKGLQDRHFSAAGWVANRYDALKGRPFDPEKNKVATGTKVI